MKCYKCGAPVTEQEWQERYNELLAIGIVAMMVPMCKNCRKNFDWRMESKKGGELA